MTPSASVESASTHLSGAGDAVAFSLGCDITRQGWSCRFGSCCSCGQATSGGRTRSCRGVNLAKQLQVLPDILAHPQWSPEA